MDVVIQIARDFGIPVAVLFVFIWRDYKREMRQNIEREKLAERINRVEDYQREDLQRLVVETKETIVTNTEANRLLIRTLNMRPCIAKTLPGGE